MCEKYIRLKFLLVLGLGTFQFMAQTSPAAAYCVENDAAVPLRVQLETYNPLGDFDRLILPGKTECCDWFDRNCNPTFKRDGLLMFSVRTEALAVTVPETGAEAVPETGAEAVPETEAEAKPTPILYCTDGGSSRIYATGAGTITITETAMTIGGLLCDSRDQFFRPINILTIGTILRRRGRRPMPMIRIPDPD